MNGVTDPATTIQVPIQAPIQTIHSMFGDESLYYELHQVALESGFKGYNDIEEAMKEMDTEETHRNARLERKCRKPLRYEDKGTKKKRQNKKWKNDLAKLLCKEKFTKSMLREIAKDNDLYESSTFSTMFELHNDVCYNRDYGLSDSYA